MVIADLGVASVLERHPDLVDKKVAMGTQNMAKGPAMSKEEAIRSIEAGMELVEEELSKGIDILGTGDMGIGNTTASSAITLDVRVPQASWEPGARRAQSTAEPRNGVSAKDAPSRASCGRGRCTSCRMCWAGTRARPERP